MEKQMGDLGVEMQDNDDVRMLPVSSKSSIRAFYCCWLSSEAICVPHSYTR